MGLSKAKGPTPLLPRSSSLTLKHKILNAPFTLTLSSPCIFLQMPLFLTLKIKAVLYYSTISKGIILISFPYSHHVLRKKETAMSFFQPLSTPSILIKHPTWTATPGVRNKEKQGGGSRSKQRKVGVGRWEEWPWDFRFRKWSREQGHHHTPREPAPSSPTNETKLSFSPSFLNISGKCKILRLN